MSILAGVQAKKILWVLTSAVCLLAFLRIPVYAQALYGPEYQVKAGFIYNFAKFTEWSEDAFNNDTGPLILCIAPDTSETDVFLSLNKLTVRGRRIEVRKCQDVKDIVGCHILFLDSTDRQFIEQCLSIVKEQGVLTIGHIKGFTREGGIINFFMEEGRLRFEVNLDALGRSGLKLSAQLLMSAEIIKK